MEAKNRGIFIRTHDPFRTGNGVIMMNEVSIDVSCSYQTNYVVEIATNVIAEDQSVDLDEHDGEFQFGIMVRTIYSVASTVS